MSTRGGWPLPQRDALATPWRGVGEGLSVEYEMPVVTRHPVFRPTAAPPAGDPARLRATWARVARDTAPAAWRPEFLRDMRFAIRHLELTSTSDRARA